MPQCCVTNCGEGSNTGLVFKFPHPWKKPEERKIWLQCVNRKNWTPGRETRNIVVCAKHFVDGQPTERNPYPILEMGWDCKELTSLFENIDEESSSSKSIASASTITKAANKKSVATTLAASEHMYFNESIPIAEEPPTKRGGRPKRKQPASHEIDGGIRTKRSSASRLVDEVVEGYEGIPELEAEIKEESVDEGISAMIAEIKEEPADEDVWNAIEEEVYDHLNITEQHDKSDAKPSDTLEAFASMKFIIDAEFLLQLFKKCLNDGCKQSIDQDSLKVSARGTDMQVEWTCIDGHKGTWHSQPFVGSDPQGNIELSTATVLTKNTYEDIADVANTIGLSIHSKAEHDRIVKKYVKPSVGAENS